VSLYLHVPHPHVARRKAEGPVKVADQLPQGGGYARLNRWLALKVTAWVGSMSCAYLFAVVALISLPAAIRSGSVIVIVAWVAQTFLQLVLLSIILVGGNVQAAAADKRAEQTFLDAEAVLAEAKGIQEHLAAQDSVLTSVVSTLMAGPRTHGGREKHL
jgi:hypothetical protein